MTMSVGGVEERAAKNVTRSCPKSESMGDCMFEKLLQLILLLACAVALWALVALPWGGMA